MFQFLQMDEQDKANTIEFLKVYPHYAESVNRDKNNYNPKTKDSAPQPTVVEDSDGLKAAQEIFAFINRAARNR